jgi:6-pyruvoyltetrahydropterin/6-carboxytetrahydropterin synthase
MERWSIRLQKAQHKFSAAHFLIFPDGSAERLHGHNYRVFVEVEADLSRHGLVMDFKMVKPLVRELCDELDEHWLIPGEHESLRATASADGRGIEVRFDDRYYTAPNADVIVMPLNNISAENLATWMGRELRQRLSARFPDVTVRELRCFVEETPGQQGVYHYRHEADAS